MKINSFYSILLLFFCTHILFSQEENNDELKVVTEKVAVRKTKNEKNRAYEPLAPARAAFYSAILPGLGQVYNGKGLYWRLPIIYGALGAGIYSYTWNNKQYNRFRDVYKARLAGVDPNSPDLEFNDFSDDQLIDRQRRFRKDQELSLLITVGLYVLNIIDANVTAHLQQFNVSKDLSFAPKLDFNEFNAQPNYGLSLNYSF